MNRQKPGSGIEWTQVWGRPGYTWNPIAGCKHQCSWNMPDGVVATCYAGNIARGVALPVYPDGFEAHYWRENKLNAPASLKTPAGIFLSSMGDWQGAQVPYADQKRVMAVMEACDQHIFFTLTKDFKSLRRFVRDYFQDAPVPLHIWLGVSMPADTMNGVVLSHQQKTMWLVSALQTLDNLRGEYGATTFMSFEQLAWNCSKAVEEFPFALDWAIIGAASAGKKYYAPDMAAVNNLHAVLDSAKVPVFHKGNLAPFVQPIRREFPKQEIVK